MCIIILYNYNVIFTGSQDLIYDEILSWSFWYKHRSSTSWFLVQLYCYLYMSLKQISLQTHGTQQLPSANQNTALANKNTTVVKQHNTYLFSMNIVLWLDIFI